MPKKLSDLLKDADDLITKKTASVAELPKDDDVVKLASELVSTEESTAPELNFAEKVAHAAALLDTLINFESLIKVAAFEEEAKQAGYSEEQITDYFEKKASVPFRSVTELIPGFWG
jgi:F420-0:gamma-glutamyl ligase